MVATNCFTACASRATRRSCAVAASASGVAKKITSRKRVALPPSRTPAAGAEKTSVRSRAGERLSISVAVPASVSAPASVEAPASRSVASRDKRTASDARRSRTKPEALVRDALAASIPGSRTEVPCSSGFVDVVTPDEIIEVKRAQLWKGGLGQVLVYSKDFPDHRPRLHLFGPKSYEHFALAVAACDMFGVSVTTNEGHSPPAHRLPETRETGARPGPLEGPRGEAVQSGGERPGGRRADSRSARPGGRLAGRRGTIIDLPPALVPSESRLGVRSADNEAPALPGAPALQGAPALPGAPAGSGAPTGSAWPEAGDPNGTDAPAVAIAPPVASEQQGTAPPKGRRSWLAWGALCLGYACWRTN